MNNIPAGSGISGGLLLIGSFWMDLELIRGFISVEDLMGGVFFCIGHSLVTETLK